MIEIDLCATDAVGDFRRTEKLYRRMGFKPFGVILSKRVNTTETKNVQSIEGHQKDFQKSG